MKDNEAFVTVVVIICVATCLVFGMRSCRDYNISLNEVTKTGISQGCSTSYSTIICPGKKP